MLGLCCAKEMGLTSLLILSTSGPGQSHSRRCLVGWIDPVLAGQVEAETGYPQDSCA